MTNTLPLLREFYGERLAMLLQHQSGARVVTQYDANNMYQYVISREEMQLSWLGQAIAELGGLVPDASEGVRAPAGAGADAARAVLQQDAADARAFVDRWRSRVEAMTDARHRGMLQVILGETLERQRFFEQALAGRTDLLGRRHAHQPQAIGEVLPTRWVG